MTPRDSEFPVAVVTGGGSGIGRAIALKFAARRWRVFLIGRRPDALRQTAQLAGANEELVQAFPSDVRDAAALERTVREILAVSARVDLLVNAAGTNLTRRSLAEWSPAGSADVLATNLHGAIRCTLAFLPTMRRQGGGSIININSEAGRLATARAGAAYVVSKVGLNGFTQALNAEERVHGIRACSIFPGDVDTPLVDRRPNVPPAEVRARFLQPQDVAEAAWFVASLPSRAVVEELFMRQA